MPAFDQMLGDNFFKEINEHQAIIKVNLKNTIIMCAGFGKKSIGWKNKKLKANKEKAKKRKHSI